MADLTHQELAEGRDPIEEAAKVQTADAARASWSDILNKMIFDQLTGKKKARSEFPAIVRGIVTYEGSVGFHSSESRYDFSEYLSNTDPIYSAAEDKQRVMHGGIIKDFKDKKILFLETPFFYFPNDVYLGDYLWQSCLMRMDITNTKAKRDFVPDEMIYITFNNIPNLSGPKFVRFPIEDKKLMFPSEKKAKSVRQKHLDGSPV